jgi:hypothetical protein
VLTIRQARGARFGQSVRVAGARWLLRVVLLAVALTQLSGCGPFDQGAVTLDETTGMPTIVVALCDGERVESVTLAQMLPDDGREALWRVEGRSATGGTFSATVGAPPAGFVETMPLTGELHESQLVITADTSGGKAANSENVFTVDELEPGVLNDPYIGTGDTLRDLEVRAIRNCEPPWVVPWGDRTGFEKSVMIGVPLCAAVAAFLSLRQRGRSGRSPASLS